MSDAWLVSMSSNGRWVALRGERGLEIVDTAGVQPRAAVAAPPGAIVAWVGPSLWVAGGGGLRRHAPDGSPRGDELALEARTIEPAPGGALEAAVVDGRWVEVQHDRATITDCGGGRVIPLHGRRALIVDGGAARVIAIGRDGGARTALPDGKLVEATSFFGGRAIAAWTRGDATDAVWVLSEKGEIIHRVAVPAAHAWAVGEQAGLAYLVSDQVGLLAVDLRYGRLRTTVPLPHAVRAIATGADGRTLVLASDGGDAPARVTLASYDELFRPAAARSRAAAEDRASSARDGEDDGDREGEGDGGERDDGERAGASDEVAAVDDVARGGASARVVAEELPLDDARVLATPAIGIRSRLDDDAVPAHLAPLAPRALASARTDDDAPLPAILPLALGRPLPPPVVDDVEPGVLPYTPATHLSALLELVAARAALAVAEGWHTGRISPDTPGAPPCEREVRGLSGDSVEAAAEHVARATARLQARADEVRRRVNVTLALGDELPFVTLCRELDLDATASQVLLAVIAPALRGELARLYGILGNEPGRPTCDRHVIELLLAAGGALHGDHAAARRDEIAGELAPTARLVRSGLVRVGAGGALTVDDAVLERLRGRPGGATGAATTLRPADRPLTALRVARAALRALVLAVAEPRPASAPLRLVLRGRPGSGRRAALAALAGEVGHQLASIDAARLPRGAALGPALRLELTRALAARAVPIVSGVDALDPTDHDTTAAVRQALRAHPGPLALRASLEGTVPLDPGHDVVTFPALGIGARAEAWADAAGRRSLPITDVDRLAARYRIAPGIIESLVDGAARRRARLGDDGAADRLLDELASQHVATRLGHVASRVTRLPTWDQVALPEEMIDSVKELVGRVRWNRTVYEDWGFDERITTARGLTALFYGPPGTGKTLVAGLIARELGLELYRVDLARVMSKWVGETEKNLGEVFDAAEDGQVMLLFDEADALFTRRTEVRSSNDRYANLEVNYLLQRLDAFEGVAVLTTNLEGSVDPAFRRRLSMRLYFPFPDEDMRARLWAAHVPPGAPTADDLDFVELARRFPLSGGYIRNSALRAAFLAAQERRPLTQEHLLRAVTLEYRELGKLAASGRME